MSAQGKARKRNTTGKARLAFLLVLICSMAWPLVNAFMVDSIYVRLSHGQDQAFPETRGLPVIIEAGDGYMWNHHAQHLGENGEWRFRHTFLDNAPEGREVHWNSALIWYLRGLGEIHCAITGDSLKNSIFRMSIWANPILLFFAIALFAPLVARRFGLFSGAITALGMSADFWFRDGFLPAYPDHHGLITLSLFGFLLGLVWAGLGWVQDSQGKDPLLPRSMGQARNGMILSAICGAVGLWISAVSTLVLLLCAGLGVFLLLLIHNGYPRFRPDAHCNPQLWQVWGVWGMGASLFFYALEYVPHHIALRLEVNHPLYSLMWLGMGLALMTLTGWRNGPAPSVANIPTKAMALPLTLMAILPLTIIVGGTSVYSLLDPFMKQLLNNIVEFYPLHVAMQMGIFSWAEAYGWFISAVPVVALCLLSRKSPSSIKTHFFFLLTPLLLLTLLRLYQTRWGPIVPSAYLTVFILGIPQVWRLLAVSGSLRKISISVLLLLLGQFSYQTISYASIDVAHFNSPEPVRPRPVQALSLLRRQIAGRISEETGDENVILLSGPDTSLAVAVNAGFKTIGTLYWENARGLESNARIFLAQSFEDALTLIQERGITHIVFMTDDNYLEAYWKMARAHLPQSTVLEQSFAFQVFVNKNIPQWLRIIPFAHNELSRAMSQEILLFRVVPHQTMGEALLHQARFVVEVSGDYSNAEAIYLSILEENPEKEEVWQELANFYLKYAHPVMASQKLLPLLPQMPVQLRREVAARAAELLPKEGEYQLARQIMEAGGLID